MLREAHDTLDRARAEVHGTRRQYARGCRCLPCRAANSQYQVDRAKRLIDRVDGLLVDAAQAKAHLQALRANLVGCKQASKLSGLSWVLLSRVCSGQQRRIRLTTEQRILAIPATPARGRLVNSYRTRHLLMCLIGEGFTLDDLARRLGLRLGWLKRDGTTPRAGRRHIRQQTAERVKRFHRQITAE